MGFVLLASLGLVACGSSDEETAGGGSGRVEATSGGEMPMMASVPPPPPLPGEDTDAPGAPGAPPASHMPVDDVGELPPLADKDEEDDKFSWGTPEADSGLPLPPRSPMNAAAKQAYDQGMAAARTGDYATAAAAFDRALAADAKAYQAAYNLGVLADRQGNEGQARQHYERALKIQPDYEKALDGHAAIYYRHNDPQGAVRHLQPYAQRWERNLYVQAIYAESLARAGRLDEAEAAARAALRRDERFVPAMLVLVKASLMRGRTEHAESILDQASTVQANNAEIHFLQGKLYEKQNRLGDALRRYQRAVELRPDYAEARMALGIQYMASGNYTQALEQFEVLARLSPKLVAVHLNLADAYRATKQWQKAKTAFDHALRMQTPLPEAHYNLGLMYMAAGEQFPNMTLIQASQKAIEEFQTYRNQMGPRLAKNDPSSGYIADLERAIDREKRRIEREARQKQQEAERAARQAQQGAESGGGSQ